MKKPLPFLVPVPLVYPGGLRVSLASKTSPPDDKMRAIAISVLKLTILPFEGAGDGTQLAENNTTMLIRQAHKGDAQQIATIYNHYITHTVITFETEAISETEMQGRILDKQKKHNWLVLENEGKVLGYAYYGTFRDRCAYDTTTESTVYLHPQQTGKGYGQLLMQALIENARQKNYRELIAGIALPNPASIQLHTSLGFEQVAHFRNIGLKFDKWIDVIFLQKTL